MSNDSAQATERHKSLYFTDGNIVILAPRQDRSGLLFRVHGSVLSSHSLAFADMFHVCTPSSRTSKDDGDDHYDGVPLIHLSDNADHLGSVLEILYYQRDLPWTPHSPLYPALVTPILDLSRKYSIDRMYAQIVRHLESDWPQMLKDWDKLERDIVFVMDNADSSGAQCIDDQFPEPGAAIKLARQFDIPSILPAAFYHLSRISILDDWEKSHVDPSMAAQNATRRTARWELLSAKDFHCLLLGKAGLAEFLRGYMNAGDFRHQTITSARATQCEVGEGVWIDFIVRCLPSADPLALLKGLIEEERVQRLGCMICKSKLKSKIAFVRAEIWGKLGDLFHLKSK